ncbi:hypothetical protein ACE6H2_005158 [Prunus campanulata]
MDYVIQILLSCHLNRFVSIEGLGSFHIFIWGPLNFGHTHCESCFLVKISCDNPH